jgi:triphosphoribosyl-dephospho-CoA synthase
MSSPPADLSALATLACLIEASAAKPGNVSPGRPFRDMRYEDFLVSAVAAGPELGQAGARPLGETILAAVRATRRWTLANTNLGIILLLTPLARAAGRQTGSMAGRLGLREAVQAVLQETTLDDARQAYAAIREAQPSGLGTAGEQDVVGEPSVTLLDAMRLAQGRDLVAREYATGFALTFECGGPALRAAREAGLAWDEATVEAFLTLLAREPDTLIARKLGPQAAEMTRRRAAEVLRQGGVRTAEGRECLAAFDAELRDTQNSGNPGTTADLTAAAVFVTLIEEGWNPDRSRTDRAQ